ncbi:MAG: CDP-alcohol phosphatidyltransferase family protein [Candidatus Omnitrophica bacterium]|nr:CDP-alcohol phosphatidyltransferase family protein [Candidatus Omnitrophota bacterium]
MGFANKVSLSRILTIPFFIASLIYYARNPQYYQLKWLALSIFFFAMLTDFADGIIARIKREKTSLGKVLDPLADKLLLLNGFTWLYALRESLPLQYKLPLSVVLIIISRDLIILLGIVVLFFLKIEISITPNIWGKLTTFFQMATILSILLELRISNYIGILACVFTLISGYLYIKRGVKALNVFDSKNNHLSSS